MRIIRNLMTLVSAVALLAVASVHAQEAVIHNFALGATDGATPVSSLAYLNGTLYGLTAVGPNNGVGMLFKINTTLGGYTILTNNFGFTSLAGTLIPFGSSLYGVGVLNDYGVQLFSINTDGSSFSNLFSFSSFSTPVGLALSGSTFYGYFTYPSSTIYKINLDGTGSTNLYTFGATGDGQQPVGSPVVSGSTLYGACSYGGANGAGTVFKINTDGSGYSILHSFTSTDANPFGSLKLSGSTLYGTTGGNQSYLGQQNDLFQINTDGSGYSVIFSNGFGGTLVGDLALSGSTLYGMTSSSDTVFAVGISGSGFTTLHTFTGTPSDGSSPVGAPVLSGTTLYGLTSAGGSGGFGTVFSLPISGSGTGGGTGSCLPTTVSSSSSNTVTRNSLYWFTHGYTDDSSCAGLYQAIVANGGGLATGFLCLPTTYRDGNNSLDAADTLVEALGFYFRGQNKTGDPDGTQRGKSPASALCKARKKLTVELIAAIANNVLLGTSPGNVTYNNGITITNFPADLIEQAGQASAASDPVAMQILTALLRKFNGSGVTNNFSNGLVECSANSRSWLRQISRDPTTYLNCPGVNNSCATAQAVIVPASTNIFAVFRFKDSVSLAGITYTPNSNSFPSVSCGTGGAGAVWMITPDIGVAGRQFTVSAAGSNFQPGISIQYGTCDGLTEIACSTSTTQVGSLGQSFVTDGINTFYIVVEGVGKLKLLVTSP